MEKTESKKRNYILFVLGLILLPVFFCTFIIDRFLMVFMVMGNGPDIVEYYQDMKYIGISVLRSFIVGLIALFIWWLCK